MPTRGTSTTRPSFIPFLGQALRVAIALGPRHDDRLESAIVVTVGEKIGQDAPVLRTGPLRPSSWLPARSSRPDHYGLPVSTTHVLSSGVAGTMAANGSGLQMSTLRNIALVWVLTLPSAMMLSPRFLYWVFSHLF